jgi:hypothetical protein
MVLRVQIYAGIIRVTGDKQTKAGHRANPRQWVNCSPHARGQRTPCSRSPRQEQVLADNVLPDNISFVLLCIQPASCKHLRSARSFRLLWRRDFLIVKKRLFRAKFQRVPTYQPGLARLGLIYGPHRRNEAGKSVCRTAYRYFQFQLSLGDIEEPGTPNINHVPAKESNHENAALSHSSGNLR